MSEKNCIVELRQDGILSDRVPDKIIIDKEIAHLFEQVLISDHSDVYEINDPLPKATITMIVGDRKCIFECVGWKWSSE